jgi:hypothetical protein
MEESAQDPVFLLTNLAKRDGIGIYSSERAAALVWQVQLARHAPVDGGLIATHSWKWPCLEAQQPGVEPYAPGVGMVLAYWLYFVAAVEGRHTESADVDPDGDLAILQSDMRHLLGEDYETYMEAAGYPQVRSSSGGGCVVLAAGIASAAAVVSQLVWMVHNLVA